MQVRLMIGGVALCAGLAQPLAAQELVTYHWSFTEVIANTSLPATGPLVGNGVIDPGEGAELRLTVSFTPAVGSPISYTPPPGSGMGTVGGLASIAFDLLAGVGHGGVFHQPRGVSGIFGPGWGTLEPDMVRNVFNGMFVLPGQTAPPANPVENYWRVRWTPTHYTARQVEFTARKASATTGTGAALYVEFGGNPQDPMYVTKWMEVDFGSIAVTVVPAPGTAAALGLVTLAWARRRRPGGNP